MRRRRIIISTITTKTTIILIWSSINGNGNNVHNNGHGQGHHNNSHDAEGQLPTTPNNGRMAIIAADYYGTDSSSGLALLYVQ